MKLIYGDLLNMAAEGHFDIIVHGCNCFNVMGGGIAYQIAQRWPQAAEADQKTIRGDRSKLGTYTHSFVPCQDHPYGFMIINAYTQYGFTGMGGYSGDVFEYEAFERIVKDLAMNYPDKRIGFPLIGCGLASGDRTRIMKIIEDNLPNATVVEWKMIND